MEGHPVTFTEALEVRFVAGLSLAYLLEAHRRQELTHAEHAGGRTAEVPL